MLSVFKAVLQLLLTPGKGWEVLTYEASKPFSGKGYSLCFSQ